MPSATLGFLRSLDRPFGDVRRFLLVGGRAVMLEGLDESLAGILDERWGAFVTDVPHPRPAKIVGLFDAGPEPFEVVAPGEVYRFEAGLERGLPIVRSYHVAACSEGPGLWRAGLVVSGREPAGRVLDNLARYVVTRLAVKSGGFALHGAGVARHGRAYVFAGKSRSGKTTAVRLSAPSPSIGDDFAAIFPNGPEWAAAPVPFDNAERPPSGKPEALVPLAGVWRLFQSHEARVEIPEGPIAAASLLACVAFAWALPDLDEALALNISAFVATRRFGHLHFRPSPDFWPLIDRWESSRDA